MMHAVLVSSSSSLLLPVCVSSQVLANLVVQSCCSIIHRRHSKYAMLLRAPMFFSTAARGNKKEVQELGIQVVTHTSPSSV
mmetsp:Transcript_46148/g.68763  ORF Transcript_46148/g.68763 Transcript_46148/m.68763 type:complete len:81 (-) Transcript_46148:416-658(-)